MDSIVAARIALLYSFSQISLLFALQSSAPIVQEKVDNNNGDDDNNNNNNIIIIIIIININNNKCYSQSVLMLINTADQEFCVNCLYICCYFDFYLGVIVLFRQTAVPYAGMNYQQMILNMKK